VNGLVSHASHANTKISGGGRVCSFFEKKRKRVGKRTRHPVVSNRVGQDFGQIEKDAAALVEDLNPRLDFKVLPHRTVERV
jgi:hypothetical protein